MLRTMETIQKFLNKGVSLQELGKVDSEHDETALQLLELGKEKSEVLSFLIAQQKAGKGVTTSKKEKTKTEKTVFVADFSTSTLNSEHLFGSIQAFFLDYTTKKAKKSDDLPSIYLKSQGIGGDNGGLFFRVSDAGGKMNIPETIAKIKLQKSLLDEQVTILDSFQTYLEKK